MLSRFLMLSVFFSLIFISNPGYAIADEIQLDEKSNGQIAIMYPGDYFTIALRKNPSTGFSWQDVTKQDPVITTLLAQEYQPDKPELLGTGGTEYWRYKTQGVGNTSIRLVYLRSWESREPALEYSVSVKVIDSLNKQLKVFVNNQELKYLTTINPYIEAGVMMAPLRLLAEELGARVEWNPSNGKTVLSKANTKIEFLPGQQKVVVNGLEKNLESVPLIIGNRLIVPLRFISEQLGAKVNWDSQSRNVNIIIDRK